MGLFDTLLGGNPAEGYMQNALDAYNIPLPDIADQTLNYNQFQNTGDLTNASESAIGANPSAMEGVSTDPRLAQAQMAALQQLSNTGQMGMTPAEKAALHDSQRQASSLAQAKSSQIKDDMARRGMGGSGSELAAQLLNAQAGADRASQNTNQISADAWNNAMNAISQSGQLAGQIGNQQFQQKSDVAKAKDYINQFNTQNAQNVQQRNVAGQNQANMYNTQNKQNVANQNVALRNAEQEKNKALLQQKFQNQLSLASGKSGANQAAGASANQAAANQGQMWGNIIGAGAKLL